ncbi:unnamed protein product, partial [Allacma fusca]
DCNGGNNPGLQSQQQQSSLSPPPSYIMGSSSYNVNCSPFGPPNCMSPSMNSYGAIGSPPAALAPGSQCMSSVYNGIGGMTSTGSCDNLSLASGNSPNHNAQLGRSSSSGDFRNSSVIANSVSSASAAAAAKSYRRSYTHAKPPYSYISLITMAIQ